MPVLAERKKMTKEELEGLIPYILEVRRREKNKELQLLQQITCHDEDLQKEKEEEDERHIKRLQDIKIVKEKLGIVQKTIQEQEMNLVNLQKEKHELVLMLKKSLEMKQHHQQQIEQQMQQQQQQEKPS